MQIEIRDVADDNRQEILALHVSEEQRTFIESMEESLADAQHYTPFHPVGLYRDGELVGFAMYGFFANEGRHGHLWLDRYLIDERFQGQGLGGIMLDALLHHLAQMYQCDKVYLSVYPNNKRAIHLYKKAGFHFNGQRDTKGEHIMVKSGLKSYSD